jgi:phosphate:Na+ symporter
LHLGFNLVLAALFFPVLPYYARLLRYLFPTRVVAPDPSQPIYLDEAARETPVVAVGAAAREALRLADLLEAMLLAARDAFATDERKRVAEVRRMDDVLDRLNYAIKGYLTGLDGESISDTDQRRIEQILAFTINLEHAGDVIDRNLLDHAAKRLKRNIILSEEQRDELSVTISRLVGNLRAAASVFMTEDVRAARTLAAEKEEFRKLEADEIEVHFKQIRIGQTQAAERSAWRLDLLRDLKRINDHLVAAAAYPILKDQGELLPTRLRDSE